ncbi:MAG: polymer-forming cytoskeletal protein [Ferruginibacter sp.]|nr:polymer-forming cytoskeletal protein [Chitinophagaceae bacterium]MBP6286070.1 polymer-forming cytoskeletal protein [Ferruginibacter sp.]MBU9936120.1 polymer-forming cytoskeletal protein [Ferruginibacter sp.]HQY12924.1 polymer-forming cytoskeletal protein [Ferruginibacter sp.]
MFNSKSRSSDETVSNASTLVGAGTTITGNIESNGDIRIDGVLKGNLKAKSKIIIGAEGVVEGDIEGQHADIMGRVTGKIRVQDLLYLHGTTVLNGDIYAGKLQIEPTAVFNGKCNMGGANIVELNNGIANAVNQ